MDQLEHTEEEELEHAQHHGGHDEEHEGGHDEPWLVSYADMMTLLFGFFVIMYSFANAKNNDDWVKVKKEFAKYFGGQYNNPAEKIAEIMQKAIDTAKLGDDIEVRLNGENLEVALQNKMLFALGKATISPTQEPLIMQVLQNLVAFKDKGYYSLIEGHTDNLPISTPEFPSNWNLSAARATTIVNLMEKLGYPKQRLSVRAFADIRPRYPNTDSAGRDIPQNQSRNRRIVIKMVPQQDFENSITEQPDRPPDPKK